MHNIYLNRNLRFLFFIFLVLFATGCLPKKTDSIDPEKTGNDKRMEDIEARELYEFNMTKNPQTGTIPEGIYEAEKLQVKNLYQQNLFNTPTVLNSYTFAGPDNLGGRTRTIAYDVRYDGSSNRIIMAGGVSGGVYKSIDNGTTWVRKSPVGEHFSCTSLAQDTRVGFRDTWYYGVGEATGNSTGTTGAFYSGNGVYKSTDNGETWARLPSSNTTALESFSVAQDFINKVIVDPSDGNVYIACPATIRRSVDGGTTWTTVLSGTLSSSGQYTDVAVTSTGRLYAAFGGTNSSTVDGVWASPPGPTSGDLGAWTQIAGAGAGGSPAGWNAEPGYGRVVLGIAPSSENLVYALYYGGSTSGCGAPFPEAELFRWDDIGGTWTDLSATLPDEAGCLSGNDPFAVQGGYDLVVAIKPDAPSTVFIGGTNAYRSTDAGLTWTRIGGYASPASYSLYASSHPDVHAFAFQPGSPLIMLCGNDGGIQRTTDCTAGSVAWTPINTGYRTYQYYYVTLDPRISNTKVIGGSQDNGSTRNIGGTGTDFELAYGGDGVSVGLSNLISGSTYEYVGSQNGFINRRNAISGLGVTTDITPTGETNSGLFVTLHKLDADNTEQLYYANDNALYRTTSASTVTSGTWTSMTGVATAVGGANDITALATTRGTYSAATASLFMGTSNGKVYRLDDPSGVASGTGPVDISSGSFPAAANVSSIAVNPRNDDTVLVTFSNYGVSGIWWTGNANAAIPTWTAIENTTSFTLPSMRSAAILVNSGVVEYYVGTSSGLFSTTGISGATTAWTQESAGAIGNAVITSMAVRPSDNTLLVGTHGYGMWKVTLTPPIPVTIISFTGRAEKKYNVLDWKVATEINNKGYFIERKQRSDNDFISIGFVPGKGNSNVDVSYYYTDNTIDLASDQTLYRLKQVDFDGRYKYSSVVIIKRTASGKLVEYISADPSRLLIRMNGVTTNKIQIRISDMNGKQMYRNEVAAITQQIPIALWPVGTYVIEIWNGNRRELVQKFIKK